MSEFIYNLETFLSENGIYAMTFILLGLGIFGMVSCGNYMKKIMCMNIKKKIGLNYIEF